MVGAPIAESHFTYDQSSCLVFLSNLMVVKHTHHMRLKMVIPDSVPSYRCSPLLPYHTYIQVMSFAVRQFIILYAACIWSTPCCHIIMPFWKEKSHIHFPQPQTIVVVETNRPKRLCKGCGARLELWIHWAPRPFQAVRPLLPLQLQLVSVNHERDRTRAPVM